MMTWWLVSMSRSRSDLATTGLGKSGYQSLGARLLVMISCRRIADTRVPEQPGVLRYEALDDVAQGQQFRVGASRCGQGLVPLLAQRLELCIPVRC
ncbi:hypothetical protein [Streptomyces sp. NPDC059631]|uniref:hypothetical protein n=1 Tax=unclassified Streptomyces TaxID=2593676 RepID=UPI0036B876F8